MSLYAIGDLHLHFETDRVPESQKNSPAWRDHERRFARICRETVRPEDTLVLVGDHSWGRNLDVCRKDLDYIAALPGRKILVRGNHDMFWDVPKTARLNEMYAGRLSFLQDNYFPYGDVALVGTKGFCFEGPFYLDRKGRVIGWDRQAAEQAEKLVERERKRLIASFEAARADGYRRFIMFLHYPPTSILEEKSPFTDLAEAYGAQQVVYAHCHGHSRFHDSILGIMRGVRYSLVSGDYRQWEPMKVLD